MVYEQNVERATKAELWAAGRGRAADVVPGPHLRRRRRRRSRRRGSELTVTRSSPRSIARRSDERERKPHRPAVTCRAGSSSRAARWPASRSFLAACGTSGTSASAVGRRERGRTVGGRLGRRRARRRQPTPKPSTVGRAQLGELDLLHGRRPERQDEVQDARGLQGQVRDDGQLPGEHRRQRRLLRRRSSRSSRPARTPAGTSSC